MGADDRIEQFEKWSRGRGLVARDVDRRRIAGELFEIAGASPVSNDHIERLVKRYRDGLVGAHKVLLARRVAEEILSWQDEEPSEPPRAPEPEWKDHSSSRPPDRQASTRPPSGRPPSDRPRSSRPPSAPPPLKPARLPDLDDLELDDLPPRSSRPSARPSGRPSARPSARPPISDPLEVDGFDSAFSLPPKRDDLSEAEVVHTRRHDEDDGDEIGGGWLEPDDARRRSSRPVDRAEADRSGTVRPRPPALAEAHERAERTERKESKRPAPLDDDAFSLDDAPKKYQAGRSKPPSNRPQPATDVPDVLTDDRGVDPERKRRGDDLTDSIAPPPVAPAGPYPIGEIVTEKRGFSLDDYISTKVLIGAGGALFIVLLLATLIAQPAFLFGDPKRPVSGHLEVENLGASLDFAETWFHAEDLDDDEDKAPWTRRVSQFYRGGDSFQTSSQRLSFVVFESDKAIASDDDARQLGTNETLNSAQHRKCEAFEFEGKRGTQCTAMTSQFGRAFGVVETWYADSGKAVFSRALIEMPSMAALGGGDAQQVADNMASFERELIAAYVEAERVVFSLTFLPKK